ncbi:cytochrome P450 [Apiospora hydei]|uniref:Cytochrome P450 n=1 Tax=Apiospora hydei TaxID=1337664 RepID=A0ABR1V4L7_9PEZI
MSTTAVLLASSLFAYMVWSVVCLEMNVRKARALKVPLVRIPFDVNNNLWVVVQPLVWKKALACLPFPWSRYPNFVRFSNRNWHFLEKSRPGTLFGPVWALVSPGGIHMHFSDPDAIQDIFSRWRDFVRPTRKYPADIVLGVEMLAVYGPSVFTVGLDDWPRHRKAMAAPFHEGTMRMVWDESLKQVGAMLHQWTTRSDGAMTVLSLIDDLKTLSLNVLASTAFREPSALQGSNGMKQQGPSGKTESYRDALSVVHSNVILLMMIPYRLLTGSWVPTKLRNIGQVATSLRTIMAQVVADDLTALHQGCEGTGGPSPLLYAGRILSNSPGTGSASMGEANAKRRRKGGLSVDEVLGNTFVINIAGLDTTSNVLSFALVLLAAYPEVQEWLYEEICEVFLPTQEEKEKGQGYVLLFPRLKRCKAVVLETLRLYPPITGVPKVVTSRGTQALRVGDQVLAIPPGVEIFPLLLGVQTDPQYWSDPYAWKPSRWIVQQQQQPQKIGGGEERQVETLLSPRKGTFFPWSEGPQYCVGRKFSQVETVAVLAYLFRSHRVRVTARPGDSAERARERAQACVNDVNFEFLLKMNQPNEVGIEFVRREDRD